MRNLCLLLVVLLCGAIVPLQGVGQTTTSHNDGNSLLPECQQSVEAMDRAAWKDVHESFNGGFCLGLVEGVWYASANVCTGQGVTFGQLQRVVLKFLQDNPEKLNPNDGYLVETALSRAFPCPKK
jgi:hypothetical protein